MNQPLPFDLSLARQLAELSRLAYTQAGTTAAIACVEAPATSTTVLVEATDDAILLAFRGSQQLRDWLTDAQFLKREIGAGIKIHHGFLDAINSILPNLIQHLLPPGYDQARLKPLIITGHSLGGALATLAAFYLQRQGFAVRAVYTFASPRVGNAAWRDAYAELCGDKTFRVVCAGDLVPLLPGVFTPVMDGFRHVGMEVLLDCHQVRVNPSHYLELGIDAWQAYRAIKSGHLDFLLYFHSISLDYLASLNRASEITL